MSNFHTRVMNIPCDASTWAPMFQAVFKEGFKQAKADAAEIVAEADERIDRLEEALADLLSAWQHQMSLYEDQPVAIAAKKVLYNK